ncbi:MAG: FAD-dependent oxidoreductase [Ktedonobacterales bacterium]
MRICVIGAGVSGLTSALTLLRAGNDVTVVARDLPPHTTSNVAAAVWTPYSVQGENAGDVERWGAASLEHFAALAATPEAGVISREVLDLSPAPRDLPPWAAAVPELRPARDDELPPGYRSGMVFPAPVIDMSVYLDWLRGQVESSGGQIVEGAIGGWDDAPRDCAVLVNCAGLGARALASDDRETTRDQLGVHAGRGQVVRVRNSGFARVVADDTDPQQPTYIVPRQYDVVLGGFNQASEDQETHPAQSAEILGRCATLVEFYDAEFAARLRALIEPAGAGLVPAEITSIGVGLRPLRDTVRLAAQTIGDRFVVHNYGHGGAGVTLSWGCAADVACLVAAH